MSSDYDRQLYWQRVESGSCGRCGKNPPRTGRAICDACVAYINERRKMRKEVNKEAQERAQLRQLLSKYQPSRTAPKKRKRGGKRK